MFGVILAMVSLAGPANAVDNYTSRGPTQVLGTTASTVPQAAGVSAVSAVPQAAGVSASAQAPAVGGLAFTGASVIGIGALGALLLVGGAVMVLTGGRRKVNA